MPLLLALTALILVEIALFVTVGGWIGLGLTLLEILASALAGVFVLRTTWRNLSHRMTSGAAGGGGRHPVVLAGDGALLVLAGLLLILPGFLTDLAGLVLLLPPVRAALAVAKRAINF